MMNEMSIEQLTEWSAYYLIEPFGEEMADRRTALLACLTANANIDTRKHRAYKVSDFMPRRRTGAVGDRRKPLTNAADWAAMKKQAIAMYQ